MTTPTSSATRKSSESAAASTPSQPSPEKGEVTKTASKVHIYCAGSCGGAACNENKPGSDCTQS